MISGLALASAILRKRSSCCAVQGRLRRFSARGGLYRSFTEASILESNAEKVAIPPNQSAFANRSEIVKGQCELKWYELVVLTANACTEVCDVADSAMTRTRFLAKKNQRAFVDFRPADRSAFERALPSLEAI